MKSLVIFRGREIVHSEIGRRILNRLAAGAGRVVVIESSPRQEGNTMVQILAPKKEVVAGQAEAEARKTAAQGEAEGGRAEAHATETPSETMRKPKKKLKLKTKRAAVKRFKVTATGKITRGTVDEAAHPHQEGPGPQARARQGRARVRRRTSSR